MSEKKKTKIAANLTPAQSTEIIEEKTKQNNF